MNRTKGFVNLNRFKSSKTIKRLTRVDYFKHTKVREKRGQAKGNVKID